MLILRRRVGESFLIGDEIEVTILSQETGGAMNIGISAPKDILILRKELQQAVSANQESANITTTPGLMEALESVFSPGGVLGSLGGRGEGAEP